MTGLVSENSVVDRWVHSIVGVVDAEADPETMADWARYIHMAEGTLRWRKKGSTLFPGWK